VTDLRHTDIPLSATTSKNEKFCQNKMKETESPRFYWQLFELPPTIFSTCVIF
jgi:hypothetical protein